MGLLETINSPRDLKNIPREMLPQLADEVRQFLVNTVSQTGGHLASNLGVVELTLALHYVFEAPRDRIIWDVGHQCYVHKILTGRRCEMASLRQYGGISGFPKPEESEYDAFATGHSSTSISAALGMAVSRDLSGDDYKVIAVIGDGALTAGMAFEALNHAGQKETDLIVILNDNGMSISRNVGAVAKHLSRLRTAPAYYRKKQGIETVLNSIPAVGPSLARKATKFKDWIKYLFIPGIIFEEMGFTYLGPIDGHNLNDLLEVLSEVKHSRGPVLLHVITEKGRGYEPALMRPVEFHGIGPFDVETGVVNGSKKLTYTSVFGEKLIELAERDQRVVAITAAMASGTGLTEFARRFPDRFFDVGICEQHAVTLAAGMASSGLKPVVAIYSTFLQRAYDQILHDVCLQNLPVVFAIDRAGLVGEDGPTHHGVFDLSYLRHMPNMTIVSPSSAPDLKAGLEWALTMNTPVALRYPRGGAPDIVYSNDAPFKYGKAVLVKEGEALLLLAEGRMVERALQTAALMESRGIYSSVVDIRFVKPLDYGMLRDMTRKHPYWVVMEENALAGGLGSAIAEWLLNEQIRVELWRVGVPDEFIEHGSVGELSARLGWEPEQMVEGILLRWPVLAKTSQRRMWVRGERQA